MSFGNLIYLDNAATTQPCPSIVENIADIAERVYGNPGSLHDCGKEAKKLIDKSRKIVADMIGTTPGHIIFTSGSTESNNTVLRNELIPHVIIGDTEHDSVRNSANEVQHRFLDVVGVNADGTIDMEDLKRILDTYKLASKLAGSVLDNGAVGGIVSIMAVNNEIGSVNNLDEIQKLVKEYPNWLTHFDCTQAIGTIPINVKELGADFITFSSHKIHGLKGTGVLYARDWNSLPNLIYGGKSQEFGLRGGTENVIGIWALGEACKFTQGTAKSDIDFIYETFVSTLRNTFIKNGDEKMYVINGGYNPGKILNLRFDGVDGETLLYAMNSMGIYISAGSACRSHENKPSHTLLAIGLTPEEARSSVRVSFSCMNTKEEAIEAATKMANTVSMLRGV